MTKGVAGLIASMLGASPLMACGGGRPNNQPGSGGGAPVSLLTYTGDGIAVVAALAPTADGDLVVTGGFDGSFDLDPSAGVDIRTSVGGGGGFGHGGPPGDAFVSRLAPDGTPRWTAILAGAGAESPNNVVVDEAGGVVVAGLFSDTVDFDPGVGQDLRSAVSDSDGFVTSLSSSGQQRWTWTFGAYGAPRVVARPGGGVIVSGFFVGQMDFDPGPGLDLRTSADSDAFVVELDAGGRLIRPAWTFGGSRSDSVSRVQVAADGFLIVAGTYSDGIDFDGGPGTTRGTLDETQIVIGGFLMRVGPDGTLQWVRTIPGLTGMAVTMAADDSILTYGSFDRAVDFDPGNQQDVRTPGVPLRNDAFASRFDAQGGYLWTQIWGGGPNTALTYPTQAIARDDGSFMVIGNFASGFDLGGQTFASQGELDFFLIALSAQGAASVRTFGSSGPDLTFALTRAGNDALFLGGTFGGALDLPPVGTTPIGNGLGGFVARLPSP